MNELNVLDIIYATLHAAKHELRINDVTIDDDNGSKDIILTTDDGTTKQCFVINTSGICEIDFELEG